MTHTTKRLCSGDAQRRARREARRRHATRAVVPLFIVLLQERMARSAAPLSGTVVRHLLTSAAASAGCVPSSVDREADGDWPDADHLTDDLYHHLLRERLRLFGATPNRQPHPGYPPDQLLAAAEAVRTTVADTAQGRAASGNVREEPGNGKGLSYGESGAAKGKERTGP